MHKYFYLSGGLTYLKGKNQVNFQLCPHNSAIFILQSFKIMMNVVVLSRKMSFRKPFWESYKHLKPDKIASIRIKTDKKTKMGWKAF